MKAVVRPFEDGDLSAVDELRIPSYPDDWAVYDFEFLHAIYRWLESHPLADENMHRWVVADGDRIVGHVVAIPQYYRIGGQRVVAHTPADFMVLPHYGFHALLLLRKFFHTCQNYVACNMVPAAIRVEKHMGGDEVAQLQYAVKLLNVSRLPVPPVPAPIRKWLNLPEKYAPVRGYTNPSAEETADLQARVAPGAVRPRAPIPAPVKRLLNGGLRVVDQVLGSTLRGGDLKTEVLEEFDESFDGLFEKVAAAVPCMPEKDAAFLRWRYGPGCPYSPFTILGVKGQEGILGYAVVKLVSRGPDKGRDAQIYDLMTLPGRYDVAQVLLREATRHLRKVGAHIIRYRFIESPTAPRSSDLQRLGFFPRKGRRLTLLAKFVDPGLQKVAAAPANWSYSMGDGEASFW